MHRSVIFAAIVLCVGCSDTETVVPPTSGPPQTTLSAADRNAVVLACLDRNGLDYDPVDGQITSRDGDADKVRDVIAECELQAGPPPEPDFSTEAVSKIYDTWVETYDCLNAAGYPTVPPPSRETFIETYRFEFDWYPYIKVDESGDERKGYEARQACPE